MAVVILCMGSQNKTRRERIAGDYPIIKHSTIPGSCIVVVKVINMPGPHESETDS